jgi:hypothetical protein
VCLLIDELVEPRDGLIVGIGAPQARVCDLRTQRDEERNRGVSGVTWPTRICW